MSDHLLYIPHEGSQSEHGRFLVERTQAPKQFFNLRVLHYGENGR